MGDPLGIVLEKISKRAMPVYSLVITLTLAQTDTYIVILVSFV